MRGDRSVYVVPEAIGARRPPSDERLRRILADIPVTVAPQRADPRPERAARHRQRHRPGHRGVHPRRLQVGTVAGDNTLIVLFPDEPALLRWLDRFEAINAPVRAGASHGGPVPMKKVVLAYSGGLDTSVAVAWLKEQYGAEVVTLTVDLGGGSLTRRRRAPRDVRRGVEGLRRGRAGDVRQPVRLARAPGQRALPGRLSAGHGARPAAARPAPGRGGPDRRARTPSPTAAPARATTRSAFDVAVHALDPGLEVVAPMRVGMGLTREQSIDYAQRARHRDPDHQGVPLLHRRQPLGPLVRDGRPRGPVGHAARRRLRLDRRAVGRARPGRDRDRLRGRHPGLGRRRVPGRRRPGRARSTSWGPRTASGGSTTSRTGSSASRAARSTRRRPR